MNKICCNKEMISLGDISQLPNMNVIESETWVCGICGKVIQETSYDYDEEELYDFLEVYEDQFKDTPIWKQLQENK